VTKFAEDAVGEHPPQCVHECHQPGDEGSVKSLGVQGKLKSAGNHAYELLRGVQKNSLAYASMGNLCFIIRSHVDWRETARLRQLFLVSCQWFFLAIVTRSLLLPSLPTFPIRGRKNEYCVIRGWRPLANRYHSRNHRIYRGTSKTKKKMRMQKCEYYNNAALHLWGVNILTCEEKYSNGVSYKVRTRKFRCILMRDTDVPHWTEMWRYYFERLCKLAHKSKLRRTWKITINATLFGYLRKTDDELFVHDFVGLKKIQRTNILWLNLFFLHNPEGFQKTSSITCQKKFNSPNATVTDSAIGLTALLLPTGDSNEKCVWWRRIIFS